MTQTMRLRGEFLADLMWLADHIDFIDTICELRFRSSGLHREPGILEVTIKYGNGSSEVLHIPEREPSYEC